MRFQHIWTLAKDKIEELVINDELDKASDLLLEVTEVLEKSRINEAIVIARRVRKLNKDDLLGIVDHNTASEEGNRLSFCILEFLKCLSTKL